MDKYICDNYESFEEFPSIDKQTNERIITFHSFWFSPFLNNYSNNTLCGPLIELLKEFSIKYNYRQVFNDI
jgi:hypothetical protein